MNETLAQAIRDFPTWRFGMFISFDLHTAHEREWANGYEDPALFNPQHLDCDQWIEAAKSAGMTYAVLTAKHTSGWCLWPSEYTTHDVAAAVNYRNGQGDIVGEYVAACRRHGLKVGIYYCGPGLYAGKFGAPPPPPGQPDRKGMPPEAQDDLMGFVHKQVLELLHRYGPIDLFWWDQFSSEPLKREVQAIQPNCLVLVNNSKQRHLTDIDGYELPARPEVTIPPAGQHPSEACDCLTCGGWFWKQRDDEVGLNGLMSAGYVVERLDALNRNNCNLLLNVPPDREGRIPSYCAQRLKEIGELRRLQRLPSDEARIAVEDMLRSDDAARRLLGVDGARLSGVRSPIVLARLAAIARGDPDISTRLQACRALDQPFDQDPDIQQWLRTVALDTEKRHHPSVVEMAVTTCTAQRKTPEELTPWLIEVVNTHTDHRLTHPAARRLARMRPTPMDGIKAVLARNDDWILWCLEDAEPTAALVALFVDALRNDRVATTSARLLLKWRKGGETEAVAALIRVGQTANGDAWQKGELRREVVNTLALAMNLPDTRLRDMAVNALAAWLPEISGYTVRLILQHLAAAGSSLAPHVRLLEGYANHADPRISGIAQQALANYHALCPNKNASEETAIRP